MNSLELINKEIESYKKAKQQIYNLGKNNPCFNIDDHLEDLTNYDIVIEELEQIKADLKLLKRLKRQYKKLKTLASILKQFITDDQVFINLNHNCFLIDGSIDLSSYELKVIKEVLNG